MPVEESFELTSEDDPFWPTINADLAVIHKLLDGESGGGGGAASRRSSTCSSDLLLTSHSEDQQQQQHNQSQLEVCPSCNMPFDKGKKRKLIDSCGHERCYSCMFRNEACTLCAMDDIAKPCKKSNGYGSISKDTENHHHQQHHYGELRRSSGIGSSNMLTGPSPIRSKVKTNGHFSSLMQTRYGLDDDCYWRDVSPSRLPKPDKSCEQPNEASQNISQLKKPGSPTPTWNRRKIFSPKYVKNSMWSFRSSSRLSNSNTVSDDEGGSIKQTSTPNRKGSQQDLYMRLGLLLGDNTTKRSSGSSRSRTSNGNVDSSVSVSSLASLENTNYASTNTSPVSTLTGSSEADPHRCNGKDPSSDSIGSLMSVSGHSSNCSSSPLIRRHSVTTSQPGQIEELNIFNNRKCSVRRSARSGTIKGPIDPKIRFAQYRVQQQQHQHLMSQQLLLKPLFFEVPLQEPDPLFLGRDWLMKELEQLTSPVSNAGVLITGLPGTGKTATILQLVEYSCFGRRREPSYVQTDMLTINGKDRPSSSSSQSQHSIYYQVNLVSDRIRDLASRVVAYHFCQADNNNTCLVPDFIHSVAAQLCQAPQLAEYKEYLLSETYIQGSLSMKECIADPDLAFTRGILEPLCSLHGDVDDMMRGQHLFLLIDALCEAEYHRPDHGDTIASFLAKHSPSFPPWLKVIATVRTHLSEVMPPVPYKKISLDINSSHVENVQKDLLDYINFRVNNSPSIQSNLVTGVAGQYKFSQHLCGLCRGSFLFARLTLDLFERGSLVAKSTSFKVLPVNLAQIYLLHFNLRFPTENAFQKVSNILSVALAALYPLTLSEIYYSVNSLNDETSLTWEEFLQKFKVLSEFLIKRMDDTYMFFHPSFREWLIKREDNENTKFLCDTRPGHAGIAFRLSRLEAPLDSDKTLELGHHILKAHLHKNVTIDKYSSTDLKSCWIVSVSDNVSEGLCTLRNIYSPNIKVSRLLLLSGASPNYVTDLMGQAPALCLFAHEGVAEMISLLLEFGAEVDSANNQGRTALILAASRGHVAVVEQLVNAGASLAKVDTTERCALVHAARNGHTSVIAYLLSCNWASPSSQYEIERFEALQQALVAAASQGFVETVEYLLDTSDVDIDKEDTLTGDTALTIAAANGCHEVCSVLLSRGCRISTLNRKGLSALMLSVQEGHWDTAKFLLEQQAAIEQTDNVGRTPLMIASAEGHVAIVELLIDKGSNISTVDCEGLTALCWACIRGRIQVVQCLIDHGADQNHANKLGRTPLDLAAFQGNPALVQLLMDKGATIEHADLQGVRPLDRAVGCRNIPVVQCFLRKGAKLGPTTWAMASGKLDIMLVLLNKLLEDGNVLYRKGRLKEASHRYSYALSKFPPIEELDSTFKQLRVNFLLNHSRCKRKMQESAEAVELATEVLKFKSDSFEAFYARAKAKMDLQLFMEALSDIHEALMALPPQNQEIRKILLKLRDEIRGVPTSASIDTLNTPTETSL